MGLFVRDDPCYNENIRQIGFNRYKQLLALRFGQWWKVGMITLAGFLPLAGGIVCAVLTSSLLVLIPCSVLGGMIAGPFLAGLYDAISPFLCCLRRGAFFCCPSRVCGTSYSCLKC